MNEVSCQALGAVLDTVEDLKLPLEALLKDVPYSPKHLRNKRARIDWSAWLKIHKNGNDLWDKDEWLRIGTRVLRSDLRRRRSSRQ